jgi:hypothetical protein
MAPNCSDAVFYPITYLHKFTSAARLVYQRPSGVFGLPVIHALKRPVGEIKRAKYDSRNRYFIIVIQH